MTDSEQHIEGLRIQLSVLQAQAAALKARLSHSVLIEVFDQSVGPPLSDAATFLVEASNASSPNWFAISLAKAADALDETRTMIAQLEWNDASWRDERGGVRSLSESTECPSHAYRDQSR